MTLSASDYLEGSLARLDDARALYEAHNWCGTVYVAGRAVESLFRCLLLTSKHTLDVGHDLRGQLKRVRQILPLEDRAISDLVDNVNEIAIVWRNDLRFTGNERMLRLIKKAGRHKKIGKMRVQGCSLKANAYAVRESSEAVISKGEPLCRRRLKRN